MNEIAESLEAEINILEINSSVYSGPLVLQLREGGHLALHAKFVADITRRGIRRVSTTGRNAQDDTWLKRKKADQQNSGETDRNFAEFQSTFSIRRTQLSQCQPLKKIYMTRIGKTLRKKKKIPWDGRTTSNCESRTGLNVIQEARSGPANSLATCTAETARTRCCLGCLRLNIFLWRKFTPGVISRRQYHACKFRLLRRVINEN